MPDAKHHQAMVRQWEMLRSLPATPPGMTSLEITTQLNAAGFHVDKRSVERNLNDLSLVFGITRDDSQMPYRWHWMDRAGLDVRSLSVADAVSTRLIEELLKPLLPRAALNALKDRFLHARKKLDELGNQVNMARWAKKVRYVSPDFPRLSPQVDEKVLMVVHQALFEDLQFKVNYKRRDGHCREGLILNPHALIQKGSVGYLVASAFDYPNVRFFALHRMSTPEITYERANINPLFDLDDFLLKGESQFKLTYSSISMRAWVTDDLAQSLLERPISDDQKLLQHSGRFQVNASVIDSFDLVCWIMSMGPAMTIIEPESLRQKILEKIKQQMILYSLEIQNN